MNEVVFIYDHFYPDYTAGGPITALGNLAMLLQDKIKITIITSAFEYQSKKRLETVIANQWTEWKGIQIWYADDKRSLKMAIGNLNKEATIYLNGLFSMRYAVYPLWMAKRLGFNVILTPRGMLQPGAIKNAKAKKSLYLSLLRFSGLLNHVRWHATDSQEATDLQNWFGGQPAVIIPDVPVVLMYKMNALQKQPGRLRLVYFSLITEKKNLYYILELLNTDELIHVELDIIGPVKDKLYWEKCLNLIQIMKNSERVIYRGEINPEKITENLPNYHALVLPTHGENFGHAIIEMLACSRPVLISDKTPWRGSESNGAIKSLPLEREKWIEIIKKMLSWEQKEFDAASIAAFKFYQSKFNFDELKMRYLELFSSHS